MNRATRLLFNWLLPCGVLAASIWTVSVLGQRAKRERRKPPPRISVPVEIVHAVKHTGTLDVQTMGVAVPFRELEVSAEVGGRVVEKSAALQPGRFVRKGEELLRIDSADYDMEVTRLSAELEKVDADLDKADVDRENTQRLVAISTKSVQIRQREFERSESLRKAQASSLTASDAARKSLLDAQQALTTQQNLIRQLDATTKTLQLSKKLAQIQLSNAQLNRTRTVITAPCTGVIVRTHVENNAHLQPGELVALIDDTSKVEVRCHLMADDMSYLSHRSTPSTASTDEPDPSPESPRDSREAYELPPIPATITCRRGSHAYQWQGTLSRQDGLGFDERTRTLPVRIEVPQPVSLGESHDPLANPGIALVRGMFVDVVLHCEAPGLLAVIPDTALRPGKRVWVMRDNKLQFESIRLVKISNGNALIDLSGSGISLTDQIIRSPVPNAKEGLAVALAGERNQGKPKDAPMKNAPVSGDKSEPNRQGEATSPTEKAPQS